MNFNIKTTTFGVQTPILDSKEVRYVRGGVTLSQADVAADGATGLKKLLAGTFLGISSGLYLQYDAAVKATKALGVVGDKNAITYTAVTAGTAGNAIKVALIDPSGNSYPLQVTVVNDEIRVQLATSGAGALTSTGAEVVAAINASILCKALVTAALTVGEGNDGSGVCAAISATALAGGTAANVTPTCMLAEDVLFSQFSESAGLTHVDQIATAIDAGRVISSRLPVAPDAVVRANIPGIQYV